MHAFFVEQSLTGTFLEMEGVLLNYINVPAKKKKLIYVSAIRKTDMSKTLFENYIFPVH